MNNARFGMQWHITDRCDQRCKHCYIYQGKEKEHICELPLDILEKILENFIKSCKLMECNPVLTITGGDPLLYSKVWEFLEIVKSKDVPFSILGNPFHLNHEVIEKLETFGCTSYQMSLDGLKKTHDYIRKPGSFDATLESLKLFKDSKIRTAIMTTVSKTNIEEIPELVDVVVEHEANNFAFARYCPSAQDYDLIVSSDEYKSFLDKMWGKFEYYKDCNTRFALKDHLWNLYLYEKGLFKVDDIDNPDNLIIDGCHCGISHITTLADGTVYACRRCESPVGRVPEQLIYDIFNSDEMEEYRRFDDFEHCTNCELKNFCRGCPAVAKCLTGNFYSKDPQCWKRF